MSRLLVQADSITKAYGPTRVLGGASFSIAENERIALVGPNGAGKTTILNLLTGRLKPDMGELVVDPNLRYGYLTQQFEFSPDATIGGLLTQKPPQVEKMEEEMRAIEARMADPAFYEEPGYEDVLTHYGELQREVAGLTSKGDAQAAITLLQELGMSEVDLEWKMRSLSGGQKTRVLLAKALANYEEMDLLILDEPSNHLDIETVEWLEDFLVNRYGNALLLVAHDRYLMDNLATKVLEIDDRKVWGWTGNYTDYREQKVAVQRALEARKRREFKEFERQRQIIEEIKRRNRFDHQAQSKATRLEKDKRDATTKTANLAEGRGFKLKLASAKKSSNDVLWFEKVTKRFGNHPVLEDVEFSIGKGDRIGLIGPNGCGKTTLLRLVVGAAAKQADARLPPSVKVEEPTGGVIDVSPGVKLGFFDQEHAGLDPDRNLIEEIRTIKPKMPEEEVRALLGRFLFKGDEVFKPTTNLSGGEKARLSLAKFLIDETNLLVLDEPTNHLDLASQDVVAKALAEYDGTLLVVSHDRHFLDQVVNKIAVIAHGKVGIFPGTFSETRTLTRLQDFMGGGDPVPHKVRKSFTDYSQDRRYTVGETIHITGNETQETRRLYRIALQRAWLEPLE